MGDNDGLGGIDLEEGLVVDVGAVEVDELGEQASAILEELGASLQNTAETEELSPDDIRSFILSLGNPYEGLDPVDYKLFFGEKLTLLLVAEDNSILRRMMGWMFSRKFGVDEERLRLFGNAEELLAFLGLDTGEDINAPIEELYPPQGEMTNEEYKKLLASLVCGVILSDQDMGVGLDGDRFANVIYDLRKRLGMSFIINSGRIPSEFSENPNIDLALYKPGGMQVDSLREVARVAVKNASELFGSEVEDSNQ